MDYKNIVLPDYDHCILGTISSILKYYNVKPNHKTSQKLDTILSRKHYKNIIFMVLDGLGKNVLNEVSKDGYFNSKSIDVVTSVFPSTTTAAMTSYYSGLSPLETGWIAWSQYFKEYGRSLDMFSHNESYLGDTLKYSTKNVFETDLNYKSVYSLIEENSDARAFEIKPEYAERRGKRTVIANNIDEAILVIKDICKLPNDNFLLVYSDNPDAILHDFGTNSQEARNYIIETESKINNLREELDDDTLIIISADHGHKNITNIYSLFNYPDIMECLIMPPSFEVRCLNLWVKEDMKSIFADRFNKVFKDEFWLMSKEDFLYKYCLLGKGKKHKKIDDFVGNYIAISTAGSVIALETYLIKNTYIKKSSHCGISREEMEVPVIVLE